jgi:flagellar hook assembly protein FlgD
VLPISIRLSEPSDWTLRVRDGGGHTLATFTGSSDTAAGTWAPAPGSVADGTYHWTVDATDGWGNGPLQDQGDITVDTTAPSLSLADADGPVPQITPNGDGVSDGISFAAGSSEPGSIAGTVLDGASQVVDHVSASVNASTTLGWDGRDDDGAWVADGTYTVSIRAVDRAGNKSPAQQRTVNAFGAMGSVASSKAVFYPQDGDTIATTTSLTFRLRSAATVDWTIRNPSGAVVRTILSGATLGAGTQTFVWNGRGDAGPFVPRGTYRSVVTATDGTFTATQSVVVVADAFRITISDTTPARGETVTVTATSAEALDATPGLRVYQPGIGDWGIAMKKVDSRTWRITITLRSSGVGTLKVRVAGKDTTGAGQASYLTLALH